MTLYVVPTPIGNLEDMTLRGLRVLREVSLILAEDTRHTRKLLSHYEIGTPLLSYHQHNKLVRLDRIMRTLQENDVALVSDAGMPSISDPGFELIQAALDAGITVDVLPGASAAITAVVAAALPAPGFLFLGFPPRRPAERRQMLEDLRSLPYTLVFYEAPHRLLATLRDIAAVLGERAVVVARELSKLHQEVARGDVSDLVERFTASPPRGEITMVVGGAARTVPEVDVTDAVAAMRRRVAVGEDRRTAVAGVMEETGLARNEAYRLWLELRDGEREGE